MPSSTFYQGSANAFGAVKDAVELYMGLRQKGIENARADAADTRAGQALQIQRDRASLDAQTQRENEDEHDRSQLEWLISNFAGGLMPESQVPRAHELGYGAALQREEPLDSSQFNWMGIEPGQEKGSAIEAPPSHPAQSRILPTNSEKSRIAIANALAAGQRNDATNSTRLQISANQLAARALQIKNSDAFRAEALKQGWARMAQQDRQFEDRLALQQAALENGITDANFDDALALMRGLDARIPGNIRSLGAIAPDSPLAPQYSRPPVLPSRPTIGDFEEVK